MDNKEHKEKFNLEDGEYICHKCGGRGGFPRGTRDAHKRQAILFCEYCQGTGKVDWVDRAMGGKKPIIRTLKSNWKLETKHDLQKTMATDLAEEMVKDIDEQILGLLKGGK